LRREKGVVERGKKSWEIVDWGLANNEERGRLLKREGRWWREENGGWRGNVGGGWEIVVKHNGTSSADFGMDSN
jgi:hypothetical protein